MNLAPLPRMVLRWDSLLSFVIVAAGLLAAPVEAELSGLPVGLIRGAALALLPYAVVGVVVSSRRRVERAAVLGLAIFNGAWSLMTLLLSWSLAPSLVGVGLLSANVLLPAAVSVVLASAVRRPELVRP
ncbi:MAG: hypothetical protein ABTQ32_18255 [Myxococcaceae bacterium]